jgi:Tat protein translocase TatB subunit
MSSVGPSELLLIFVIALLILGPERLPKVASQLGRWVGRARRTANQLRYQLEREIAVSDIKQAPKKPKPPGEKMADAPAPKADEPGMTAAEGESDAAAADTGAQQDTPGSDAPTEAEGQTDTATDDRRTESS